MRKPLDIEVGCVKITELGKERGFVTVEYEHDDGNRYELFISKIDIENMVELLTTKE